MYLKKGWMQVILIYSAWNSESVFGTLMLPYKTETETVNYFPNFVTKQTLKKLYHWLDDRTIALLFDERFLHQFF